MASWPSSEGHQVIEPHARPPIKARKFLTLDRALVDMSGIVFLSTRRLDEVVRFYRSRMGMNVWIEQEDCTILRHGDLALGFCQRDHADTNGIITFWYDTEKEIDDRFKDLMDIAEGPPRRNEKYRVYHFFLRDPEERRLEVQQFLDL
jgi:catechol 2,3-dioxygenase-like lactoylglutathione lyase family enzyme